MDELLTMSKKELTRLEVIQRVEQKRLRQKEASEILGISTRQVRRLQQSYREHKEEGLISKRRGKPSNNRLEAELRQDAIDLLYSRYHDFKACDRS
jgi:transposase